MAARTAFLSGLHRPIGVWLGAVFLGFALGSLTGVAVGQSPRVFLLRAERLEQAREAITAGDGRLTPALEQLREAADGALRAGPFSVVNKEATPPSGDKHDYMSLGPYWWPDPASSDGLPYIRRDGERNPEIYKIRNRLDLGEMTDAVETLALAHYFTQEKPYADRAALLVRTWFLDPATRMNPHLEYGQAIPGINTGRGIGLIETRAFARVVDAVGLLADSTAWTAADQRELEAWFAEFLEWMRESDKGRDEARQANNHGTYYDLQVASYALFLGKPEIAREVIGAVGPRRIAVQIEPDGQQPLELARTKAWSYSVGNLAGLMSLARLGEHVGVDLWEFETDDGRSIRSAIDFLLPFATGDREWPYPQITGWSAELMTPLLQLAATQYSDPRYQAASARMAKQQPGSRSLLILSPLEPINQLHTR